MFFFRNIKVKNIDDIGLIKFDFVCYLITILQISLSIINIYLANIINKSELDANSIVTYVLYIFLYTLVFSYVIEVLTNLVLLKNEIKLRKLLCEIENIPPSRINNDVLLAVNSIYFIFLLPGSIITLLVYVFFLAHQNFINLIFITAILLAFCFPIIQYFKWRGAMISSMRNARNVILDFHSHKDKVRRNNNEKYFSLISNFWRKDSLFGAVYVALIFFVILFYYHQTENYDAAISEFLIILFIFRQGRILFNSYVIFQENKKSLRAIEQDLKKV